MKLNHSMKSKIFFILILLMILSFQICCQRGGGSRSRSSRSSSSSRSYSSSRRTSRNSYNSTSQPWQIWQILILISIGGVVVLLSFLKNDKQKYQSQTRRITDAYEQKYQQNPCTLEQDQRNNSIDWFMNNTWTVQFKSASNNNGSFNIKITDIVKRTDYVYEIKAVGVNDTLGESDMKGILLFQSSYLSICFDKVYNDREKAGQTGKWSVLVYEGVQQGEVFSGQWYFEGFEGNGEYSGEMKMFHN